MKSNYKLFIGLVAGLLVGAAGNGVMHGQEVKTAPVYVISEVDTITDPIAIGKYGAKASETLAPFDGHFVVRGGKIESLDGDEI